MSAFADVAAPTVSQVSPGFAGAHVTAHGPDGLAYEEAVVRDEAAVPIMAKLAAGAERSIHTIVATVAQHLARPAGLLRPPQGWTAKPSRYDSRKDIF